MLRDPKCCDPADPTGQGLYRLPRIGIDYFDTIQAFQMKISGGWRLFSGNRP